MTLMYSIYIDISPLDLHPQIQVHTSVRSDRSKLGTAWTKSITPVTDTGSNKTGIVVLNYIDLDC